MSEGAKQEAKIKDVATVLILDGGNYKPDSGDKVKGELVVELYRLDLFCLYIAIQSLLAQEEISSDHAVALLKEVAAGWATKNSIEGHSDNPLDTVYDYIRAVEALPESKDLDEQLYNKAAELFAMGLNLGQEDQKKYADLVSHSIQVYYEMLSKVANDYRLVA